MPHSAPSLSGSTLKFIAAAAMFLDHVGACVFEHGLLRLERVRADASLFQALQTTNQVLRTIGRVSFPIFCFLLVEGFLHTHNARRYALRLFLFALLSELPYNLAIQDRFIDPGGQNIFFTLLIGLLAMMLCEHISQTVPRQRLSVAARLLVLSAAPTLAHFLHADYDYMGVILIELLYLCRFNRTEQIFLGAVAFCWEMPAPLAFLPVWFYDGRRGLPWRWFFYWFYPVHLLLLSLFTRLLLPLLV